MKVKHCSGVLKKSWFVNEASKLLNLAFPLCVTSIFNQLPFFITLQFVGHFSGARELSATALGNAFINVTGNSMLIGIATAADTLGPQSYGFKNYKQVGVILQRGLLILCMTSVPIAVMLLNSESLLLLARQVPCVVSLTGKYTRIFVLAFPARVLYIMLQRYMQAQSLVWVLVGIGLAGNMVLVLSCVVFIVGAKLGTIGASLGMVLSYTVSPVLLIIYIKWRKLHLQTWGGWSFESLTEWWQFLRLGIPGLLTLAFEWWSFEISVLVSGSISELQLAINATILLLMTMYFMASSGMAKAVNVRVGNELGAAMFALSISAATFACRNYIGFIFTSDEKVIAGVADAMIGAIGIIFSDQIQGVISGVMRATGRQTSLAVVNFFCYYILGLPLGITLALKLNLKAKGVWMGLSVGTTVQAIILFILLLTTNWKKQSEKAMGNARSGVGIVAADHTSSTSHSIEELSADMELVNVDGGQRHPLPLDHPMKEEQVEGEKSLVENFVTLPCEDTERLIYLETNNNSDNSGVEREVGQTRPLYKSSSKLCQSKSSILVCRGFIFLVCLALLLGGLLMAVTIQHHPMGCDQVDGDPSTSLNCSFICYQQPTNTIGMLVTPVMEPITPTKVLITPTYSNILPSIQVLASPTVQVQLSIGGSGLMESECQCLMMPTPSFHLD